ncbi:MAG: tetratricopeptide repeat protein [Planctomycetota bacterium]
MSFKTLFIIAVLLFVLVLPLALMNNFSMSIMEDYAGKNKDQVWAPDWLMRLGRVYRWTFREERGIVIYKNFMERYPTHSRYPEAKWLLAYCLEQNLQNKEAARQYEEYADWYPDRPDAETARKKADTLKYKQY